MALGKLKCDSIENEGGSSIDVSDLVTLDSGKAPKASPTFTGTVTLPATTALAGQASDVTIIDNNAAALEIKEGTNAYMTFDTSDTSEKVTIHKAFDCDSTLNVDGVSTLNDHLNLTAQKELRLQDSSGGQYVAIKAPATVDPNVTLTLPANDGDDGQYLQTDGSGGLTWADVAGDYTYTSKTSYSSGMIFTSIPSTVTQMILLFDEIKNSSDRLRIQLGTSSAFTSSGYSGHVSYHGTSQASNDYTNGIHLYAAGHTHSGWIQFFRTATDGPTWYWNGSMTMDDTSNKYHMHTSGRVETGGTYSLNRMILENMNGSGDSGSVTLGYK